MAIIFPKEQKKRKKWGFFFKIGMFFLLLGIVLRCLNLIFLGELSHFVCCMVILVGIEYFILHHITYFTGKKIERVISLFFYTGIVCLVLKLSASLIFNEDYYAGISPFVEVHDIIIFGLNIGLILLPLSVVLIFLKYSKILKFLNNFF